MKEGERGSKRYCKVANHRFVSPRGESRRGKDMVTCFYSRRYVLIY